MAFGVLPKDTVRAGIQTSNLSRMLLAGRMDDTLVLVATFHAHRRRRG